ncbi:putative Zn-dependent peptidase [Calidifontibacter indicus]|uniref:Putative Zn-dependent peptidase n=2 Tax=Calidifontibacter indicus TaxID=419650 RepID=A0A3D9UR08_9MICO|nr:putative Zn-dependent peptidase [Calidifontibacter indicus]
MVSLMPLDFELRDHTLDNGLRVVVAPDPSVPIVAVNLWVNVGSRHEQPGRTGLAHLFEHLMFQGSRNVAEGEHMRALMGHGARLNATTWFDRTNYFETVPTGVLDLALWLEADRHGYLLDAVTQTCLDNQRDVVKEEKQQRYDNRPYGHALEDLYALIFPDGHPYQHSTIGSMDDLDAATLDDVHAFYKQHYGPDNTVLTLVGDVGADEAIALADKYFGGLPRVGVQLAPPTAPLPALTEPLRFERVDDVPADRLHLGFRLPPDHTREFLVAEAAMDILAGLATSRLYRRAVRGEQAATHMSRSAMGLVDGVSLGLLVADVADDSSVPQLESLICEELDRLADEGPTEAEMKTAFVDFERGWLQGLAVHEERADTISHYTLLHDDPQFVNTYLDDAATVTADEVRQVADTWLRPQSRAVVVHKKGDAA